MTNPKIIAKVKEWQNASHVHPLTCGNDSNHPLLKPEEVNGKVILVCPGCSYRQNKIPAIVLKGVPDAPNFFGEEEKKITKNWFVSKKYEENPSVYGGLSRAEVMELNRQRARELGNRIRGSFPEVELGNVSVFGPFIKMSLGETEMKELVEKIQSEFDCTLVDAETPIELIR